MDSPCDAETSKKVKVEEKPDSGQSEIDTWMKESAANGDASNGSNLVVGDTVHMLGGDLKKTLPNVSILEMPNRSATETSSHNESEDEVRCVREETRNGGNVNHTEDRHIDSIQPSTMDMCDQDEIDKGKDAADETADSILNCNNVDVAAAEEELDEVKRECEEGRVGCIQVNGKTVSDVSIAVADGVDKVVEVGESGGITRLAECSKTGGLAVWSADAQPNHNEQGVAALKTDRHSGESRHTSKVKVMSSSRVAPEHGTAPQGGSLRKNDSVHSERPVFGEASVDECVMEMEVSESQTPRETNNDTTEANTPDGETKTEDVERVSVGDGASTYNEVISTSRIASDDDTALGLNTVPQDSLYGEEQDDVMNECSELRDEGMGRKSPTNGNMDCKDDEQGENDEQEENDEEEGEEDHCNKEQSTEATENKCDSDVPRNVNEDSAQSTDVASCFVSTDEGNDLIRYKCEENKVSVDNCLALSTPGLDENVPGDRGDCEANESENDSGCVAKTLGGTVAAVGEKLRDEKQDVEMEDVVDEEMSNLEEHRNEAERNTDSIHEARKSSLRDEDHDGGQAYDQAEENMPKSDGEKNGECLGSDRYMKIRTTGVKSSEHCGCVSPEDTSLGTVPISAEHGDVTDTRSTGIDEYDCTGKCAEGSDDVEMPTNNEPHGDASNQVKSKGLMTNESGAFENGLLEKLATEHQDENLMPEDK